MNTSATVVRGSRLPSYRKPPVAEVVVGLFFDQAIPGFLIPHVGLFWQRIMKELPNCEHFTPAIPGGQQPRWIDSASGLPLPRVWLLSESKDKLAQVQGDCFFFNWRKQADSDVYPRYLSIVGSFEKHFGAFLAFLKESGFPEPKPMACELTYINHIPQGIAWKTIDDLGKLFREFSWSGQATAFLPNPRNIVWSAVFALPENSGTLTTRLTQVTRISDASSALRLEMSAKGLGSIKSVGELRAWYDVAHEWIVRGFSELTTSWAQHDLWEREDA